MSETNKEQQRLEEMEDKAAFEKDDRQAINACIKKYSPWLRSVVQSCLRAQGSFKKELVEDILQEVWLEILKNKAVSKWDPDKGRSLRTFLIVRVRLRAKDFLNMRKNLQRNTFSLTAEDVDKLARGDEDILDERWFQDHLDEARALIERECNEEDRKILNLRLQGMSEKEIAARLGISTLLVSKRIERARKRLAEIHAETVGRKLKDQK